MHELKKKRISDLGHRVCLQTYTVDVLLLLLAIVDENLDETKPVRYARKHSQVTVNSGTSLSFPFLNLELAYGLLALSVPAF